MLWGMYAKYTVQQQVLRVVSCVQPQHLVLLFPSVMHKQRPMFRHQLVTLCEMYGHRWPIDKEPDCPQIVAHVMIAWIF